MSDSTSIAIVGLSSLDVMELEREFRSGGFTTSRRNSATPLAQKASHGDLGLSGMVALVIGKLAITGLAVWLTKKKVPPEELEHLSVRVAPDGTFTLDLTRIKRAGYAKDPPNSEAVKKMSQAVLELIDYAAKPVEHDQT